MTGHCPESIEFACVFEEPPSVTRLTSLLNVLVDHPEREVAGNSVSVACWNDDTDIESFEGDPATAAAAIHDYEVSSVTVQFGGFELRLGSEQISGPLAGVAHVTIRASIHAFTTSKDAPNARIERRRRRFAAALESAASTVDPEKGFGRRYGVTREMVASYPDRSDAVPPLYDYNLFGAGTVESIGRKQVATAPAWHVSMFESGGAFVVVRPPHRTCSPTVNECATVAAHLNTSVADVP